MTVTEVQLQVKTQKPARGKERKDGLSRRTKASHDSKVQAKDSEKAWR
jgi:hypothetical protein